MNIFFNVYMSSYLSNILKLAGATAFAQALTILASPIITRMYSPEAFGLSALFSSVTAIIAIIACLRYDPAIMLPLKEEDAANLLALSFISATIMGSITALVIWLCGDELLRLVNAQALQQYLWLVPISVFLSGISLAMNYWNSRTKKFGRLSIARVAASIAGTGTQVGAGFAGHPTGGSLIGAGVLALIISTLLLSIQIWRTDIRIFKESIGYKRVVSTLKRYKRFPIFDSWATLLNTVSWQLPIFLLSAFFSPKVVGYYSLGMIALQMPMSLVGSAIGQVFFQQAADANFCSKKSLARIVESTFYSLFVIGLFPIFILLLAGNDIFIVIFGPNWGEAGVYAQILALWIFFWFIYSPISTLFSIFEIQGKYLLFNVILIVSRASSLILGGFAGDARIALTLFSILGLLVYAGVNFWLLSKADISIKKIFTKLLPPIILSIALLSFVAFAKWYLVLDHKGIVFIACFTIFLYYIIILFAVRSKKHSLAFG